MKKTSWYGVIGLVVVVLFVGILLRNSKRSNVATPASEAVQSMPGAVVGSQSKDQREEYAIMDPVIKQVEILIYGKEANPLDGALKVAEDAVKEYPSYASAHLILCRVYLQRDEISQAETALEKAKGIQTESAWAMQLEGKILLKKGKLAEAETILLKTLEKYPVASNGMMKLIRMRTYLTLAQTMQAMKKMDAAKSYAEKALATLPDDTMLQQYVAQFIKELK
jgi:tetratricopeptide (TPR) repeat protein